VLESRTRFVNPLVGFGLGLGAEEPPQPARASVSRAAAAQRMNLRGRIHFIAVIFDLIVMKG